MTGPIRLLTAAVLALAALLAASVALAAPHPPRVRCPRGAVTPAAQAGKPVWPCDFADPMVLRTRGRWYAWATSSGWDHPGQLFPALESRDLRHWRFAGDALRFRPAWAVEDFWAPSVVFARGRYELFYSALRRRNRVHCIGVATSASPTGPFRDRGPLACGDRDPDGRGYIDPAPLLDRGGRQYLYVSVDRPYVHLSVLPLSDDGLRVTGPAHRILRVDQVWQRSRRSETVEAPFPVRRGATYALLYSAGCYCADYRLGYATASSPLGPFTNPANNPILASSPALRAPGSGSVFRGPNGVPWLAFHAWTGPEDYLKGGIRTLRLAPLDWTSLGIRVELP